MRKGKGNVRNVKFSQEEMAYEPPKEIDFGSGLVFQGMEQWRKYLSLKRGYVKLDPDVRKAFPNDRAINDVLRHAAEIMKLKPAVKQRKSA